ncbi:HAD family hydrolase [Streptomyces pyxinae]|uniref:HAD family hydrolase n=1 Tax=Streptomyces pyxinae TaxID=2970734 RepID=UPI00286805D7|nr:HAD-IIB family hydrolase [Streptomyces sp. LP05-1]
MRASTAGAAGFGAFAPRARLLACDLDGTLLDSAGRLPEPVSAALFAARDAGLALAVITARPRRDVEPEVTGRVPGSAYWAYSNGAVIHPPGAPVPRRVTGFAPDRVRSLLAAVRGASAAWSCALDLVDRTVTVDPFPRAASEHWSSVVRCASADRLALPDRVPKLLVHTGTGCGTAEVAAVQRAVGPRAAATASGGGFVELVPPGTGKSAALRWLCADLGMDPADAVAAGDGLNDLSMLRLAGLGAAPANAHPEVRAAADLVLPSNDEAAVGALVGLLLDGRDGARGPDDPPRGPLPSAPE